MRVVVFTSVIGQTDTLRPRQFYTEDTFLCFTDDPGLRVAGWEMVVVPSPETPEAAVIASRRLKILAHQTLAEYDHDASLWLDAAFELYVDPAQFAERWLWRADMLTLRHPDRDCIAQEGAEIIRLRKAPAELIRAQLDQYQQSGYDVDLPRGLTSTGLCLRRNSRRLSEFNAYWWRLFAAAGHGRDQMSVDMAVAVKGLDVIYLSGHYRDNPYAKWHKMRGVAR